MIDALARGWLVAWIVWSAAPVGALVLTLIHRVTGGRWGEVLAPALRPAMTLVPLAALAFLGVAAGLDTIYPWASGGGAEPPVKPDVLRLYLDPTLFLLRAVIALIGWSVLAWLCLGERVGKLAAGAGLSFYGFSISLVAVDWILSVEPGFNSSAFAAGIALCQILAALAFAALMSPRQLDEQGAADLAGLMLAALLGVIYLDLMSYIVAWYGDLPPKAKWYLKRGEAPWNAVLVATLILGGVLPFVALLFSTVRRSPALLRGVGLLVMIGLAGHFAWFVLPAYGQEAGAAAMAAIPCLAALIGLSPGLSRLLARGVERLRHA